MKLTDDALLQAAAAITQAKIAKGYMLVDDEKREDVVRTLAASLLEVRQAVKQVESGDAERSLATWKEMARGGWAAG